MSRCRGARAPARVRSASLRAGRRGFRRAVHFAINQLRRNSPLPVAPRDAELERRVLSAMDAAEGTEESAVKALAEVVRQRTEAEAAFGDEVANRGLEGMMATPFSFSRES